MTNYAKTGAESESFMPSDKNQQSATGSNVNTPVSLAARKKMEEPLRPEEVSEELEVQWRHEVLHNMLLSKCQEILKEVEEDLGRSLAEDQQRRLESAGDAGDQALMDLERERGISLMEMRNRRRQSVEEALIRLREGTYGICAECGVEISGKRLQALPFAKLCVECQSRAELLEKIEREEEREEA